MRHTLTNEEIGAIANIISRNTITQIQREMYETNIDLRYAHTDNDHRAFASKLHQFEIARLFMQSHPARDRSWQHSFACFQELTDFFLDQASESTDEGMIKINETNAMRCWYLQLNNFVPEKINPSEIIILGKEFCSESCKFSAFLYWLLSKNVTFKAIEQSQLLHHYFAYHSFDISVIKKTYTLFSDSCERAPHFLTYLSRVSCGLRGMINAQTTENTLRSLNVLGEFFIHQDPVLLSSEEIIRKKLSFDNMQPNYGEILYKLFGWTLFVTLDFFDPTNTLSVAILSQVLKTNLASNFFDDFQRHALNGELDEHFVHSLLLLLSDDKVLASYNSDQLTEKHPFYVHLFPNVNISKNTITSAIKKMAAQKEYHTVAHLCFLVPLYIELNNLNLNKPDTAPVLETIFNTLFFSPTALDDTIYFRVIDVHAMLKPFFIEAMEKYETNINVALAQYVLGDQDYDAVQTLWGNQLEKINLIKYFYPEVSNRYRYPWSKYALRTHALEMALNNDARNTIISMWTERDAAPHNTQLVAQSLQNMGISTEDEMLRTLQEVVLLTRKFLLVQAIVEHVLQRDGASFSARFFHKSFSDGKAIVDLLFEKYAGIKLEWMLNHVSFTQTQLFDCYQRLLKNNDFKNFLCLLNVKNPSMTQTLKLIPAVIDMKMWFFEIGDIILKLCSFLNSNVKSRRMIARVLKRVIDNDNKHLLFILCTKGARQLSSTALKNAAHYAMKKNHLTALKLLCGISDAESDINTFRDTVIELNNISLLLNVIEYEIRHAHTSDLFTEKMSNTLKIKNSQGETLLHLAAKNPSYPVFARMIQLFDAYLLGGVQTLLSCESDMGLIPHAEGESPIAKRINVHLETLRKKYMPPRVANLSGAFFATPPSRALKRDRHEEQTQNAGNTARQHRAESP